MSTIFWKELKLGLIAKRDFLLRSCVERIEVDSNVLQVQKPTPVGAGFFGNNKKKQEFLPVCLI